MVEQCHVLYEGRVEDRCAHSRRLDFARLCPPCSGFQLRTPFCYDPPGPTLHRLLGTCCQSGESQQSLGSTHRSLLASLRDPAFLLHARNPSATNKAPLCVCFAVGLAAPKRESNAGTHEIPHQREQTPDEHTREASRYSRESVLGDERNTHTELAHKPGGLRQVGHAQTFPGPLASHCSPP